MSILVLTSDTLIGTPAAGNLEYNGQFFGTDSNASRAQLQRLVLETSKASTSGTSVEFTGIPAWVKKITVMLSGVSTSGTSQKLFQLGTGSTTYTTSGYASNSSFVAGSVGTLAYTNGFNLYNLVTAADTLSGIVVFTNITGNTWVCSGSVGQTTGTSITAFTNGTIALGAALTAVRFTTVLGTDTFDAGTINILYEG